MFLTVNMTNNPIIIALNFDIEIQNFLWPLHNYFINDVSCKLYNETVDSDEYHYVMKYDHFNRERRPF